jgi:hypothetical protein
MESMNGTESWWQPKRQGRSMVSSLIDTLPLTKAESDGDLDFCFLDLALALAAKGEGQVKPNPLVGSVM